MSVPFPHVERERTGRRPALVVARRETGAIGLLLWTVMVTNAERPAWIGDVAIPVDPATGLRHPSKVRTAKIATIEAASATRIGRMDERTWSAVVAAIAV